MDAPYYNGGPDDYPFRQRTHGDRDSDKGRCPRCGNPILVPFWVEGLGDVCSFVCQTIALAERERKVG